MLMAIGMSLCINNTRAVIEGLVGYQTDFHRTPKYGLTGLRAQGQQRKYLSRWPLLSLGELGMALYFVVALYHAYATGLYLGMPFLLLFHAGFLYTGLPLQRPALVAPGVLNAKSPRPKSRGLFSR